MFGDKTARQNRMGLLDFGDDLPIYQRMDIDLKKVYVTGDGPCPWCNRLIEGDKPETHHTHKIGEKGELLS